MSRSNGSNLDKELSGLEATAAAFATHCIPDANVRKNYIDQTRRFSAELRGRVARNLLTSQMAAQQAQSMRNTILEAQRSKSTAFGLSIAEFLKKEGKTLSELESKYAAQLFNKDFGLLSNDQKNEVWRLVVRKSGEPRVSANRVAIWMGHAGKGLFLLTITIAVYHIAVAEDKIKATVKEGTSIGGGVAGASALGSVGLACGPAAIACVPVGIFVGGVLGSMGIDWAFERVWQ